ncbi:MAG: hypothetical protein QM696_06265 [Steroidobacteraceae bacterium]
MNNCTTRLARCLQLPRYRQALIGIVLCAAASMGGTAVAAGAPADGSWLKGIYVGVPDATVLKGGKRNSGSPEKIAANPAFPRATEEDQKYDPLNECMPLGAFRMMARPEIRIEFVPQKDRLVMLFEEISLGRTRVAHLDRGHRTDGLRTWQGDTVGKWNGNVLTLDTVGFNDRTWLNGDRVRHGEGLHLVETLRPLEGGEVIEYTVKASDPEALASPYSYTRYFRRNNREFRELICVQHYDAN